MFAQLCVSHFYMNNLPKEKLAWVQLRCFHGSASPHISSNTNKYKRLCELAHHTKRRLRTANAAEALCCFHSAAPVWKLFKFKLIVPLDSNTQRRLHYFCITQHAMELPQFFLHLHSKSSGSAASVRFDPFCSTQRCQSHPALSPLLICCPTPSVIQQ